MTVETDQKSSILGENLTNDFLSEIQSHFYFGNSWKG